MDLARRLGELAQRVSAQLSHISTEEATKNALVLPFITALGYNVFDPTEVTPELTADVGVKKGEKVDYAVLRQGKPIMLFECKIAGTNLDRAHSSQLYRYFSVTDARFAILTNGIVYRFFTDLDARNRMDSKHFLEVDLLNLTDGTVAELSKFHTEAFDEARILETASELKYTGEIKRILGEEMTSPSEDFVRFFASQVYEGRMTHTVREQFAKLTKQALREFVSERVSDRLKSALAKEEEDVDELAVADEPESEIDTTEDERQAYYVVKAIVSKVVAAKRVVMRDQKTYCGVLLDDNNRKPICRLWFNTSQKYLGTFDAEKNETRNPIESVEDIYAFADQLRQTGLRYEGGPAQSESPDES
jgi:hypothetical protein